MTRKTQLLRRQQARQAPPVYTPHPSWSRRERASGACATIAPDDFWSRLGL